MMKVTAKVQAAGQVLLSECPSGHIALMDVEGSNSAIIILKDIDGAEKKKLVDFCRDKRSPL